MAILVFKYFWTCLHVYFFSFSAAGLAKKELSLSSRHVREIIKETDAEQALLNSTKELISKNPRLLFLYDRLKDLPRDGTSRRKLERSDLIRNITKITKNSKITLAVVFLAQQNCKTGRTNDMITLKGIKRKQ